MWVSKYSRDTDFPKGPLSANDRIRLLDERVRGWILEPARALEKADQHSGYALLNLVLPYFEMIAQCEAGTTSERKSGPFFSAGLRTVLGAKCPDDRFLRAFYAAARCGCFHDGLAREDVVLSGSFAEPIEVLNGVFQVNPHRLLAAVESHFVAYLARLRHPGGGELVARLAAFQAEALADSKSRMADTISLTILASPARPPASVSPPGCSGVALPAEEFYGDDTTGNVPS